MKKVELPISGMSCALRIENALKEVGEIADVKVNFSLERAEITFSDEINLKIIKKRIEDIGYGLITSKV